MTSRPFISLLLAAIASAAPVGDVPFKQHYEAGIARYQEEDFQGAIDEFKLAYEAKPRPRLLFNIGQAYRKQGNAREALRFYLLYQALDEKPKPDLKTELEGYIVQMKAILQQAELARRAEDRPVVLAPSPAPLVVVSATPEPPPRVPVYRRGWFWGVLGGVAATVVVTGLAAGLATRDSYGGDVRMVRF